MLVAGVVGIAQAQTPSGFKPAANTKLDVIFNTTKVTTPGELLTKAATASQPRIALPKADVSSNETFVFVMLDLDVPPANGNTTRRVLLHAMTTGFKATQQSVSGGEVLLASSEKGPAAYIGPGPPATDTKAHRYTQLLFKQPAGLAVKASDFANQQARINFDIAAFAESNGRGGERDWEGWADGYGWGGARNTSGSVPFEGGAGKFELPLGIAGLVGGLALLGL
ncbi:hypothetical protein N0V90_008618 [Kalmusia sp. IMI 367209]|nr:hypothetical protein N0V90_008618 [Kalmusia sp. IMI 367209]